MDITDTPTPVENENNEKEEDEDDDVESPYDRFTPRSLLDRHPSLLRCSPQKVTTTSFMASKFSVSTPNLTKLIQEDSMFEEERKKHEQKLNESKKKKNFELAPSLASSDISSVTSTPEKKKLSVPEHLKTPKTQNESDQEIYGSEEYRQRFQSYNLSRDDSFGAVHRRPKEERRAQYPISMAFTDSLRVPGLQPISVDIDIDETPTPVPAVGDGGAEGTQPEKGKMFIYLFLNDVVIFRSVFQYCKTRGTSLKICIPNANNSASLTSIMQTSN